MSATTSRRANISATSSPTKSTPRRVLGDLTPKALNTPSKQTNATESSQAMRAQSPLKQVTTLSPQHHVGKENAVSSGAFPHGRKRSLHEMEGAEDVENAKATFGGRDLGFVDANMGLTSVAVQTHLETTTVELPVPGSPTERNTPTPEPESLSDPADSQDTQVSKESFSNFIDFGLCASQKNDQPQPPVVETTEERKSRAELLRARLGFGMYKVKTNQVSKRGSDIISNWEASSSSEATNAYMSPAVTTSAELSESAVPSITLSPARHEHKPTFIEANLDPFRPIGKLTPAPVLLPTAVSSRMVNDYHMPSSPPQNVSPEKLLSPVRQQANYTTPVPKRTRLEAEHDEEEYSDDEDREETIEERLQRLREKRFQDGDLTSSVVKGHAAKGLLELMSGHR